MALRPVTETALFQEEGGAMSFSRDFRSLTPEALDATSAETDERGCVRSDRLKPSHLLNFGSPN
ncbi:hypothetical protein EYF80_034304 [Liparis tanakae]|uniref:Uncharacterized protein n=1 Tax=Liparis tanakae TaxID=230148 RepID=A0A4Z2GRZ6_9TELE|nr:hypothetical protein EYF80_034304 [Liparis tanakae]